MKCPVLKEECSKENCPWWSDDKNCCSVKVIGKELSSITQAGFNIAKELTLLRNPERML